MKVKVISDRKIIEKELDQLVEPIQPKSAGFDS